MIHNNAPLNASEVTVLDYKRENGIVAWMDRGGSNVEALSRKMPGLIRLIATADPTHPDNMFELRARELRIPTAVFDIPTYETGLGAKPSTYATIEHNPFAPCDGMLSAQRVREVRRASSEEFLNAIRAAQSKIGMPHDAPIFGLGGMQRLYPDTIKSAPFMNVHPGDLTFVDRYKGHPLVGDAWKPAEKAIKMELDELRSTTSRMNTMIDEGPIFVRGYALPINYGRLNFMADLKNENERRIVAEAAQEALKRNSDHVAVGATLEGLFDGLWGIHEPTGEFTYQFDGEWYSAPNGITIEEHVDNKPDSPFVRSWDDLFDQEELLYEVVRTKVAASREKTKRRPSLDSNGLRQIPRSVHG